MKRTRHISLIILAAAVCAFFTQSCRSPQRLIEKAVKKDPKTLNEYADTMYVYTDSIDTVYQEITKYIESKPRIIEKIIDNRKEIKEKKIEARNDRQETRQKEKTQRKDLVQDNRTNRRSLKEFGKSVRVGERQSNKTTRQDTRQKERSARSNGWWLFAVLLAFVLGMITMRIFSARMNWKNKV